MSRVIHYCRITNDGVVLDGEKLLSFENEDTSGNLLALYR